MQGHERKGTAIFPPPSLSWLAVVWTTTKSNVTSYMARQTSFYHILHTQRKLRLKNRFTSLSGSQATGDQGHMRQGTMPGCLWVCLSHMPEEHCKSWQKLLKIIISLVHLCWLSSERHCCLQTVLGVLVSVCDLFPPETTAIYYTSF